MHLFYSYEAFEADQDERFAAATFSASGAMQEYARNVGRENPEREWISTPLDSWEKNPFFTGKPGKHPESYDDDEPLETDAFFDQPPQWPGYGEETLPF